MTFLGLLGIFFMIIENEMTFNRIDHKDTTFSLMLKATITFSTIILVGLVFYYHRIDMSLYCVDNSIDDWRIALTRKKIFAIAFEALICSIHPIPGHFIVEWSSQYVKKVENNFPFMNPYRSSQAATMAPNTTRTTTAATTTTIGSPLTGSNSTDLTQSYVPIDVMLSLPSKSGLALHHLNSHLLVHKCSSVCICSAVYSCFTHISFVMHRRNRSAISIECRSLSRSSSNPTYKSNPLSV